MIAKRGLRARHPVGRRMSLCSSLFCPGRGFSLPAARERASSHTHDEIATPLATVGDSHNMRSQAIQKMAPLRAQAAAPERPVALPGTGFASSDDDLVIRAIFTLPATWCQRACFRAKLHADLKDKSDFLRDIGIEVHEAQAEASRFFWEPITLKRR
jgi:uncharacterized protein YjiS (DUF1127 family)